MPTLIAFTAVFCIFAIWLVSTQRRLVVLDENVNNAMSQIGMQLACRFDALTALLNLTRDYARQESDVLIEALRFWRGMITAKSTPEEVLRQEGIISEALQRVALIAKRYPELQVSQKYGQAKDASETFADMMRTSRLIYNDSVAKLNRQIRVLPASLVARMLGIEQRVYLEELVAGGGMQESEEVAR